MTQVGDPHITVLFSQQVFDDTLSHFRPPISPNAALLPLLPDQDAAFLILKTPGGFFAANAIAITQPDNQSIGDLIIPYQADQCEVAYTMTINDTVRNQFSNFNIIQTYVRQNTPFLKDKHTEPLLILMKKQYPSLAFA